MSFYGTGQPGNPVVPNQAQMVRAAGSLQPQLFGQLQFPQGAQSNPFDQNSHLILQSQAQAQGFQNLNVSFLNEQLAGVLQATSNASNMQNLMTPMAMTSLSFPSVPVGNVTQPGGAGQKQRVFTGTVTKAHDNFGFIDDEVFFTTAAVKGPILPKSGDRVLVEAEFNPTAAFKWTATRIQIVNIGGGGMGIVKSNSPQNSQQQNYQMNVSAAEKSLQGNRVIQNPLVAPPPPIISLTSQAGATSRHTTSTSSDGMNYSHVSIISNPHSVYSHSSSQQMQNPNTPITAASTVAAYQQAQAAQRAVQSPVRGRMVVPQMGMGVSMGVGDGLLPMQFNHNAQIPSLFTATPELNSNSATMDLIRNNERDMDRMDNRADRDRDRERERERDRERERERDKTRREKEKVRDAEREKERERDRPARKRSQSPPPKKAKTDLWHERQLSRGDRSDKDKEKGKDGERSRETDRVTRNPSPTSSSTSRKRSRSRSRPRANDKEGAGAGRTSRRDRDRASPRPRTRSRSSSSSQKPIARYNVVVPQYPLDLMNVSVMDLKKRYQRLYIPSDFFLVRACWLETFPLKNPLDLAKASPVVVFRKHAEQIDMGFIDVEPMVQKKSLRKIEFIPEPEDARRLFSAKVMLMSNAGESTIYTNNNIRRVINFIVGLKLGKSDVQAIGGPWSASQDGLNPQSDPQVLIRTAIRTTKTSVGIDLSSCKRWFRFMELYYRRSNGVLETVVFFIPDISTCLPSDKEWRHIGAAYKLALGEAEDQSGHGKQKEGKSSAAEEKKDSKVISKETISGAKEEEPVILLEEVTPEVVKEPSSEVKLAEGEAETGGVNGVTSTTGTGLAPEVTMEVEGDSVGALLEPKGEAELELNSSLLVEEKEASMTSTPTGNPQLDPKQLNVAKLREELSLRGLSTKGLKAQLQIRLTEALEGEKVAAEENGEEPMEEEGGGEVTTTDNGKVDTVAPTVAMDAENVTPLKETKESEVKQKAVKEEAENELVDEVPVHFGDVLVPLVPDDADEKTKQMWRRRFSLPKKPHLLVHPLQAGKTKDFDCSKMSLASIREYIHEVKEASFEVNLFSEFFNEMLARDFAFKIYKEAVIRTQLTPSATEENDKKGEKSEKGKEDKGADEKVKEEKIKEEKVKDEDEKKTKEKEGKKEGSSEGKKVEDVGDSKKSAKTKATTVKDNPLLLAFSFFDTSRCGYIKEVDFEEICLISGLNLTRAQIRKVTQKIFEKESQFRYSLWTENPLSPIETEGGDEVAKSIQTISSGNNDLLPVFVYLKQGSAECPEGISGESLLVPLNGSFVDVRKLKEQNETYEAERRVLEANLNALTNNMVDAQLQVADLKKSNDGWKSEYLKLKETAKASEVLVKTQTDDLDTFRRASERFFDRVKGVIDMKGRSHSSGKEGNNGTSTSGREGSSAKSETKGEKPN